MAGANPAMIIRIAATLDELKRNLAEGRAQIETTTAGMAKLAASFSGDKLVQHAHNVTAAINQVGASTLSAAEAARNLSVLERAMEKLDLTGRPIPPAMRATADALSDVVARGKPAGGLFSDLTNHVKATALGFISAQAVIGGLQMAFRSLTAFIGSAIESFAAAEASQKKLTVALQAGGRATPEVIQGMNALAMQFQRTTVYSDDLITEMQALLVQLGNVAPSQMQKALEAATNLATGLGIELPAATMLVAKAFAGGGDELGRLKAILGDTVVAGTGMAGILDAIQAKFGGQAQAEIETYSGRVKQLANDWDNLKEAVGKAVVENPFVIAALRNMTQGVQNLSAEAETNKGKWTDWFGFVGAGFDRIQERQRHINEHIRVASANLASAVANAPALPMPASLAPVAPIAAMREELERQNDAYLKAAAAAKAYADAFRAGVNEMKGVTAIKAAEEGLKRVTAAAREGIPITKMTDEQQKALNTTMGAALDVYRAQGKVAPESIRAVYNATLDFSKAIPLVHNYAAALVSAGDAHVPLITQAQRFMTTAQNWPRVIGAMGPIFPPITRLIDTTKEAADQFDALTNSIMGAMSIFGSFGQSINQMIGGLKQASEANKQWGGSTGIASAMFSKSATDTQKWSAGIQSASAVAGGAMNVWAATADSANKSQAALTGAMEGAKAGAAFGPWGLAIGAAAGAVVGFIHQLSAGRRAVKDFAEAFGGFDGLREKLLVLGDEGERLWIKLTQQTGKGDKAGAQRVIEEINAALAKQAELQEDAIVMTQEGAVATIETASEAQAALDELGIRLTENVSEWEAWGASVRSVIDGLASGIRAMPLPSGGGAGAVPMAAGGDFLVTRPTLFLAGEAGPERATFTPGGGRGGAASMVTVRQQVVLDRRVLAEAIAKTVLT